jgi:hypothetical protein
MFSMQQLSTAKMKCWSTCLHIQRWNNTSILLLSSPKIFDQLRLELTSQNIKDIPLLC